MHDVRAISIDLDDTLWPIAPVIQLAEQALYDWLRAHCPRISDACDIDALRVQRQAFADRHPHLRHDLSALRLRFLAELLTHHGYRPARAAEAFDVFMRQRNQITLYPDTRPALASLRRRFPLVSVSNGNADLRRIGLSGFFVHHIAAREVGVAKPHRDVFMAACRALGTPPEQTVHVGDDPTQDVLGAAQLGMATIWVNRSRKQWEHAGRPDAEVTSLSQVVELLQATR